MEIIIKEQKQKIFSRYEKEPGRIMIGRVKMGWDWRGEEGGREVAWRGWSMPGAAELFEIKFKISYGTSHNPHTILCSGC